MKKLILLIGIFAAMPANAEVTLKGIVKDANGSAPIRADIHINPYGVTEVKSYECSKDGLFTISIPEAGMYQMRVSAVNHEEISLPMILDESDRSVEVQIQLKANPYAPTIDRVRIIGDWNNFKFSGIDTMAPLGNVFTFSRKAESDTLSYQLLDVAGGHSVNGTQQDYYVYDGGGDYRSVIRTTKGETVTITFDPSKVRNLNREGVPVIRFPDNPFLEEAAAFEQSAKSTTLDFATTRFMKAKNAGNIRLAQFVAVILASKYNETTPVDSTLALEIFQTVPATSPMWAIAPLAPHQIASRIPPEISVPYLDNLAEKNPNRAVRAVALGEQLAEAYYAKDENKTRSLHSLLQKEYGDVPEIKFRLIFYNPDAKVQVDRVVPDFDLDLLDGSGKITNKTLLGKYYLIDFWATWCGPCVEEMPTLHQAYAKFKGRKGFEILSISMDAKKERIAPFRKKWQMPWKNTFIEGQFNNDVAKAFEVVAIPKPILVDPTGKIVAMQEGLRGDNLEKTLEKFLGVSN